MHPQNQHQARGPTEPVAIDTVPSEHIDRNV